MPNTINFAADHLRITSARLTDEQLNSARVLGGPHEVAGIVKIEIAGETVWGSLGGQVVNRGGLQLSAIVYPTYEQARRGKIVNDELAADATADAIDSRLAELDAIRATEAVIS